MANGQPEGMESGAISGSFSPDLTHYLLIVVGEPLGEEYVDPMLDGVEKALQCWDVDDVTVGYDTVLQATAAAEVNKIGLVHRSLVHCGSSIGVVILINPTSSEVTAELRNLLIHSATNKHLIFGGHYLEGGGDWVLHNDTFTLHDIADIFSEPDVDESVLKASQNERQTLVVSGCHWQTATVTKQTFTKSLNLTINPQEVKNDVAGITLALQTIRNNISIPSPFELLEPPTMGVGVKCKITKPTVLIFPASKGDCAFFAVTDFSIFLGGGYCTKSCFWKFAKHLHRIDAIMAQHMQPDSLMGFNSLLKRKIAEQQLEEPEKGSEDYEDWSIKCNSPELGVVYLNAPENKKSPLGLQLKTVGQGNLTQQLLKELDVKPFPCMANGGKVIEPITLYQKVGIGRLDMFILTPVQDSKELKDFLQQWSSNKAFSKVKTGIKVNGKESECPITSAVSICALIVWQPARPHEDIVKVLFPGNASQGKILEGLDRLKHLDYLKHADASAARLSKGGAQLKKKPRVAAGKVPVKANGPTLVINSSNQAPCTDGAHCNTPPPCVDNKGCNTPPPKETDDKCSDGIHCGTPPLDEQQCTDGDRCNTPPPCVDGKGCNTPPPCIDGKGCNTPPPCIDGNGCNTPPPKETNGECCDGIHCGTPPPDDQQCIDAEGNHCNTPPCKDGNGCNTPPPKETNGECCDGIHCGTPPPENDYDEDACGNFAPIEPYKCTDGNCNTPPPEGDVMFADGTHCNAPPPEEDGEMDTQESPVDNEPQATVQEDICGNLMDSNLPESQQDMGSFAYSDASDPLNNKPSDAPERLASGEITPSDQVEYGNDSPALESFVFGAEAGSKEPVLVPTGFGDFAEEDHGVAASVEGYTVEQEKRDHSDNGESLVQGGAFYDESPSPNDGPHPWEPQIELSSPDQEAEDNLLTEEPRPEADSHGEFSEPASFTAIPPPIISYSDQNTEQEESQPLEQGYSQDAKFEQEEDAEEEEDSSEASQASEIEVKPDQQFTEEQNHATQDEQMFVSPSVPADDIEIQDEEREDVGMVIETHEDTPEEQALDQGLPSEDFQSLVQSETQVGIEHEVVAGEVEQLLEAEVRDEPVIQEEYLEGQEGVDVEEAYKEQVEVMEEGQVENVESPAPEEDQDQVVLEEEYGNHVPPTEEPVAEAMAQDAGDEINQNFMTSQMIPPAVERESIEPEADINDNGLIQEDVMVPAAEPQSYPEADADLEKVEESEDLVQFESKPMVEEPSGQEHQVDNMLQESQYVKDPSYEPEGMQAESEEEPKSVEEPLSLEEQFSVEAQEVPITLISEPPSDDYSQPLESEPIQQEEIISEPVPEYEMDVSYEQDAIQERSSSEPLADSLSEPQSDKEPDSLSEPQIVQSFESYAEAEANNESVEVPSPQASPQPEPEVVREPSPEPSPVAQPEPDQEPSSLVEPAEEISPESTPASEPSFSPEVRPEPAVQESAEVTSESKPDTVPVTTAVKTATSVSSKSTTKTCTTTTKKPGDKTAKKDVKSTKSTTKDVRSTTKDTKSMTKVKTSSVTEKRNTTKAQTTSLKKLEPLGSAKARTQETETKATPEKKQPERKPLADRKTLADRKPPTKSTMDKKPLADKKLLAERKPATTEKKTPSRLSAGKSGTGSPRPANRDKSPAGKSPAGKLWEKPTAASASRSSSSNSRTKTNGSGDNKSGPAKKPAPSKSTLHTPSKTGTQRPTGSKTPGSARKPTESARKETDRPTRSAPGKIGDAKKSDSSKRPVSSKTGTGAAKSQPVPVSGPPVYIDLAYVPNHASEDSVNVEFFRRIRSKNYVISANDKGRNQPSMSVLDALLEAKAQWDDREAEVTVIPTHDISSMQEWEQKNTQQLNDTKITISQPASRSIVQMKDENFFMYKVEF